MHLGVGEQRQRRRVEVAQVAAHDQRRAGDRPQRHQRALLVRRESACRARPAPGARAAACRHRASAPGRAVRVPVLEPRELRLEQVGQSSQKSSLIRHICACRRTWSAAVERRLAGRQAEDHRPAGAVDGACAPPRSPARGASIRPADVVHLDEVDAPGGEQREDAVVVGLRAGLAHVDAVHVRIPRADAARVRDVLRAISACPGPAGCASTASRGMPRIRWMPNFRPSACTCRRAARSPCRSRPTESGWARAAAGHRHPSPAAGRCCRCSSCASGSYHWMSMVKMS